MFFPQQSRSRRWLIVSLAWTVFLPMTREARAVLLYSTETRNTSAPADAQEAAAWNLQAQWESYLVTPISSQYFLAAKHVAEYAKSSQVIFDSVPYDLDTSFHGSGYVTDPDSDLLVGKITGTFSRYADLYDATAYGSEESQISLFFGRGTQRGTSVTVSGTSETDLRGWKWGPTDLVQSWGKNIVTSFGNYTQTSTDSLLYYAFDRSGTDSYTVDECALSVGDSSGGVFIYADGEWKLAGINYAAEGPFSYTGAANSGFDAAVFDMGGLYVWNGSSWTFNEDQDDDLPGISAASRVSDRLGWIVSQVPEPSTITLLALAAVAIVPAAARRRWGR